MPRAVTAGAMGSYLAGQWHEPSHRARCQRLWALVSRLRTGVADRLHLGRRSRRGVEAQGSPGQRNAFACSGSRLGAAGGIRCRQPCCHNSVLGGTRWPDSGYCPPPPLLRWPGGRRRLRAPLQNRGAAVVLSHFAPRGSYTCWHRHLRLCYRGGWGCGGGRFLGT